MCIRDSLRPARQERGRPSDAGGGTAAGRGAVPLRRPRAAVALSLIHISPIAETYQTFGDEIDRYTMDQAVADGITVSIKYHPRIAKVLLGCV